MKECAVNAQRLEEERQVGLIPEPVLRDAAEYLRSLFSDAEVEQGKQLREEEGEDWFVSRHFSSGMVIRNELRRGGFGEVELGIDNLDYVYVKILEAALDLT